MDMVLKEKLFAFNYRQPKKLIVWHKLTQKKLNVEGMIINSFCPKFIKSEIMSLEA